MDDLSDFYAVIPAGGSGTRLWPLSRQASPKFLHALGGGSRTLLQSTVDRLAGLCPPERTFVVCGAPHAGQVAAQLPELPGENLLVEPGPRNSGPAIGLAAAVIARRNPKAVFGSFAADHLVADVPAFTAAVRTAAEVARTGRLVTVGITPTRAETGYGYIKPAQPLDVDSAYAVAEFAEKPGPADAERFVAAGYLWNASMFVWSASTVLDQLDRRCPELGVGLREVAAAWDTPDAARVLGEVWPTLPSISIDNAIVEGAAADGLVATVPADLGWNDVGDWRTLADVVGEQGATGPAVLGDPARVVAVDAAGCLVVPGSGRDGRVVAVVCVDDVVVVDTDDAVLVVGREHGQRVRDVVDALRERGRDDVL